MRTTTHLFLIGLVLFLMIVMPVSAEMNGTRSASEPTRLPAAPRTLDPDRVQIPSGEPDDGLEIQNVTAFLVFWNDRLQWNLSEKQITNLSVTITDYCDKNLPKKSGIYHISNRTKFDENVGEIAGLTHDQITEFIDADRKQLILDHQNYETIHDFDVRTQNYSRDSRQQPTLVQKPAQTPASHASPGLYLILSSLFISIWCMSNKKIRN